MRRRTTALVLGLIVLAGCAKPESKPATTLTEHQRDSVLATEPIPGASTVGRAMQAADREANRAAQMDSMTH